MGFIQFRNGWDGAGSQTANWMQGEGERTISNRARGDVKVERNGDFTNVYKGPDQDIDGIYSLGAITDGTTHIVGSPNGWNFGNRGLAPTHGGFATGQVGYYGKGLGEVNIVTSAGHYTDFDGKDCQAFKDEVILTRDGRTLGEPYYSTFGFLPHDVGFNLTYYMKGGYYLKDGVPTFGRCLLVSQMIGDQHVQSAIADDGKGNFISGEVAYFPNQLGWYATPTIIGPGALLKMDRYLRPTYTGSSVVEADCPGLYFSYTLDNGLTWTEVASAEMFDAEMVTMTTTPGVSPTQFNKGIEYAEINTAPLSLRYHVIIASVPYIVPPDGSPGATPVLKMKVKMGLLDVFAGCTMSETAVLFDGEYQDASYFSGRPPFGVPGGVMVCLRDISHPGGAIDSWKYPSKLMFTADGTSLTEYATMPLPENYTGIVNGYDTKTMVCSMWDVETQSVRVYRSRDLGLTWKSSGIVAANAKPPNDTPATSADNQYFLTEFGVITALRRGSLALPAMPMTPWLTDCRREAPIL